MYSPAVWPIIVMMSLVGSYVICQWTFTERLPWPKIVLELGKGFLAYTFCFFLLTFVYVGAVVPCLQ